MQKVYTHYDNLKVSRNAPLEVIRAAYKALSQINHPDRNSDNPDASKIMAIINASYEVLSNPIKRKEHDFWIAEKESAKTEKNIPSENSNPVKPEQKKSDSAYFIKIILHIARYWAFYVVVVIVILLNFDNNPTPSQQEAKPYISNPTPEIEASTTLDAAAKSRRSDEAPSPYQAELDKIDKKYPRNIADQSPEIKSANPRGEKILGLYSELYPDKKEQVKQSAGVFDEFDKEYANSTRKVESVRVPSANKELMSAPNGEAWPAIAGYVKGYKKLNAKGLSSVTVDNSQNDSNVFVKLVSLNGTKAYPTRQFYIPAYGKFTVNKVTSGSYDVRYRDLSNGGLSRSESFKLEEVNTGEGTQFSNITMTLYKVQNGNMQTYGLSEVEF